MLLKKGNSGAAITQLQSILTELNYDVIVTGTFDTATESAVRKFQSTHRDQRNTPLHVDGQVGDMTWQALLAARALATTGKLSNDGEQKKIPQSLIDHLKLREGWRTKVYLDSLGKPTAGMGHLLTPGENKRYNLGETVPEAVLNDWMSTDIQKAYDKASEQAKQLKVDDINFVSALTSVVFQLGSTWDKKFPKTWALMAAGKWNAAAEEIEKSLWFEQTPVRVKDFQIALRALS